MSCSDSGHSDASKTAKPKFLGGRRAALTRHEIETVKAIRDAFKATDSVYCCSGHVPAEVKRPAIFYALAPATFATEQSEHEMPIASG